MEAVEPQIHIGIPQLDWEIDEYPAHQRSKRWYVIAIVFGVAFIIYGVATANFLFAVIILMVGVITALSTFVPPERVPVIITNTGVVLDDTYYDFEAIKDFSIAYEPPHIKILYLKFRSPWQPLLTIPLEDIDPNLVREILLPFCLENIERTEESLTDSVRRLYKL
ncbi:MAG: hypothetical protein A2017_19495 [Lentisphaerae bacterium GWF2_44_16]|nr:MAG: hypothetical protein A2017_19495 [Lentisphaerae bacterium GWF2_44_16]HAU66526.1 hypothetical protein [Candidatus Uhrbacteria bacterium]